MFEQTLINEAKTARKPYSMVLSLLLQIVVMGVMCLLPFVFTQALPTMQLKTVLAGPPKPPPPPFKAKPGAAHATTAVIRSIRLADFVVRSKSFASHSEVRTIEAPPNVGGAEVGSGDPNGVPGGVGDWVTPPLPPPKPPLERVRPPEHAPIHVGTMSPASMIRMIQPPYPPIARINHVQGVVEFTATLSKQGTIENLILVRGHPLLVKAAQDAVLQWRYRPTLLNGTPVEVITDIVVNFTLSQ